MNSNSDPRHKILPALCALLAFVAAPLSAQDITVGAPVTFAGLDDGQNREPLTLKSKPRLRYPAAWRDANFYEYAILFSPSARSTELSRNTNLSRHNDLNISNVTHRALDDEWDVNWKWETAARDMNDPRRAWVAIIFNPASASASKKNAAPRLLDLAPVFLPDTTFVDLENRVARADITVGAAGEIKGVKITSTGRFAQEREAAVAQAVSKWKIAPARNNGAPVEATINVPILFLAGGHSKVRKTETRTMLTPIKQADTVYPKTLKNRQLYGHVTLEFALDDKGRPLNPVVVLSYNKEFNAPALDAIRKYRFEKPSPDKPDSLGDIHENPSDARWQYDVNFKLPRPSVKGQNVLRPVMPPEKVDPVAPVYPYEMLKAGITGSATVNMPCSTGWSGDGRPDIIDASQESFGYALAAAVRFYKIKTKPFMGKTAAAMLIATFDFNPANPELRLSEKTKQLLADETNAPEKIISEDKLDKRLKIRKAMPNAKKTFNINDVLKGTTVIEFLVDETGLVHLPRIVMTETPEAAYLLMQQISMRTYDPPMQNGRPVVARAREKAIFNPTRNLSADKADE